MVETVFGIIAGIQRDGTTVLMVEQNAYLALQLATRAYVMETGRITLEGPARALLDHEHVKRAYLGEWRTRTGASPPFRSLPPGIVSSRQRPA